MPRIRQFAATVACLLAGAVLLAPARAQIVDEPRLEAARGLVAMIDGSLSQGAGVVFAVDKGYVYIATMLHVVRRAPSGSDDGLAKNLKVRFHQDPQTALPAEHVDEVSPDDDLAVIRVRAEGLKFDFARLGNPQQWKNGMRAFAIGQPAGKRWGTTYQGGPITDISASWLEVEPLVIKPGHSGGALIDQDFRLIGLVKETDGTTARALRIDRAVLVLASTFKLKVQLTSSGAGSEPEPLAAGTPRPNSKDGLTYVWIPRGKFRMGCSESPEDKECDQSDEFPTHDVTISRGFWMGQTEVTVAAYERFRASTGGAVTVFGPTNQDRQRPAVAVTWDEAANYCAWAGDGLRLPTEAEWEYAARAGNPAKNYGSLNTIAWFGDNSGKPLNSAALWAEVGNDLTKYNQRLKPNGNEPHPVGTRKENPWKLFDMLGNVWEWTADGYDADYYKSSPDTDPTGPSPAKQRVLRGGSWSNLPESVRVSDRYGYVPSGRNFNVGFRCAGELR